MKSVYSHAYYVGNFNGHIDPHQLDSKLWKKVHYNEEYAWICSMYYQGHVDAMIDENENKPTFLKDVCHYKLSFNEGNEAIGQPVSIEMKKDMGQKTFIYNFRFLNLHLYFFPLGITFVAIEIEDSGTDLNELTAAHSSMIDSSIYKRPELSPFLQSLSTFLPDNNPSLILGTGNKFKLFQVIQIDSKVIEDSLLFELGTSSPVGCVGTSHQLAPSQSYFERIIKTNTVSAFNDWKGLALMDSFTMLSNGKKKDNWTWERHFYLWNTHYFNLIYLRCFLEKTFCFSRNTEYRMNKSSQNLSYEIAEMERYYFYKKISYNFLPNLLYKEMSRGMELAEEREELSKQVKERAQKEETENKEKEQQWKDRLTAMVGVFAILSVMWDLCSTFFVAAKIEDSNKPLWASLFLLLGMLLIIGLLYLIFRNRSKQKSLPQITVTQEAMQHLSSHFTSEGVGSKFYGRSPEQVIQEAKELYPKAFLNAKTDHDGRIRLSFTFPREIGTSSVIHVNELSEEEKNRIETITREGCTARQVKLNKNRFVPTTKCQMVFSSDWHLITMFPGEMAPPLPASPDTQDEYWDNHVFVEPIKEEQTNQQQKP